MQESPNKKSKTKKWSDKFGNKIMAAALVSAIIPVLLLGFLVVNKLRTDLIKQALSSQKTFSDTVTSGVDALIESFKKQLEMLCTLPAVQSMQKDMQVKAMYDFFSFNPVFYSILIYDIDSCVNSVAYRNREEYQESKYLGRHLLSGTSEINIPAKEAFKAVLRNKKTVVANSTMMVRDERMLLIFVPIFDFVASDKIIGVLSCAINLEGPEMNQFISGYEVTDNEIMLLTDLSGKILTGKGNVLPEGLKEIKALQQDFVFSEITPVDFEINQKRYIGIISPARALNGYLLAAKPSEIIFGFLHSMLLDLFIILFVAIVISVAFGYVVSKHLADKINTLLDAIKKVSAGIISHRVEIEGSDELSEAGLALNKMIDSLEKHRMIDESWSEIWKSATTKNSVSEHKDE